jgi:hypothetical protein
MAGRRLIAASVGATALFGLTTIPAALGVDALDAASLGVAVALFLMSLPVWVYALAQGALRSRDDLVTIGGLFFGRGAAPLAPRRWLLGAFGLSVVIAAATAPAQPAAVLVPMFSLGIIGAWTARYGSFPRRPAGSPADQPR